MLQLRQWCVRYEIPTFAVALLVYGGWLGLTLNYHSLPWPVHLILGSLLICLHGSLQHETTHQHPLNAKVATAVGYPPISLWMPFEIYRDSHQTHHHNEDLTDPLRDPESYYLTAEQWQTMPEWRRQLHRFFLTGAGRLLIGPAYILPRFWYSEFHRIKSGDFTYVGTWLRHFVAVGIVLYWIIGVCDIPLLAYLFLYVYPGTSLALLRSFYEHRYEADPLARCVVVEQASLMEFLFLNNNYHVVHHQRPSVPWFMLDDIYRENRDYYTKLNSGYRFKGYLTILRQFFLTPVFEPVHPAIHGEERILPHPAEP